MIWALALCLAVALLGLACAYHTGTAPVHAKPTRARRKRSLNAVRTLNAWDRRLAQQQESDAYIDGIITRHIGNTVKGAR